jgi:polyferredoxin
MLKQIRASQGLRLLVQLFGLILGAGFLVLMIIGYPYAMHAFCPFATICFGLNKGVIMGSILAIFGLTVAISIGILIHSMFFGRQFCGYLCPLGTWQEAIFSLRGRKYRTKNRIPIYHERRLSKLKYIVLVLTALLSVLGIAYFFIVLCPLYALSLLPRQAIPGLAVFLLISIGAAFVERLWCRWLCPYAALLNTFEGIGAVFGLRRSKIHRNLERCVDCGCCSLYCPMNINLLENEYVQSPDCIHCLMCAKKCPKSGTICCEKETK